MEMSAVTALLAACVRMATPLTLAGLGEAYSERAGILNIGVEGIMLCGAFAGFITSFYTQSFWLGVLAAMCAGALVALLHAVLSIRCLANQNIVGLALNFLALGLTSFLFLLGFADSTELPKIDIAPSIAVPGLSKIPFLGPILFEQNIFVYLMLVLLVGFMVFFYKTEWGVHVTAVGEHPRAADTAGLAVFRMRYMAALANGLLGGLAGACITLGQLGFYMEDVTAGRGYMALVCVILGRRNPVGIFVSALFIGFAEALQFQLQTIGFNVPSQVFSTIPYMAAVLVLLLSIGKSHNPAALGIPYERDKR